MWHHGEIFPASPKVAASALNSSSVSPTLFVISKSTKCSELSSPKVLGRIEISDCQLCRQTPFLKQSKLEPGSNTSHRPTYPPTFQCCYFLVQLHLPKSLTLVFKFRHGQISLGLGVGFSLFFNGITFITCKLPFHVGWQWIGLSVKLEVR